MSTTCHVLVKWTWHRNIQLILWQPCEKYFGSLVCPCSNLTVLEPTLATGYWPFIIYWCGDDWARFTKWFCELSFKAWLLDLQKNCSQPYKQMGKEVTPSMKYWILSVLGSGAYCKDKSILTLLRNKTFPHKSLLIKIRMLEANWLIWNRLGNPLVHFSLNISCSPSWGCSGILG